MGVLQILHTISHSRHLRRMLGVRTEDADTIAKSVGATEYVSTVGSKDSVKSAEEGHFASTVAFAGRAKNVAVRASVSTDDCVTFARLVVGKESVNTVEDGTIASIVGGVRYAFMDG
uniref:Uncharacterized protein n=1 Tax=Chromera velia CCMP2878 TaxID=1169474 RepID=A0A0G4GLZ8_9ALVE|eukprot:Cvel_4894.t1-p1 / transcript=Cvel_4894.t1 / gene=Cvel_4894 / organism=Chromera_velia_CCMP2878 / gene_product=Zinc finger protein 283, putative / transcript_product=Zinc finger protein 283, putative / location=Cvel_scaffold220:104872-105219(-) / protein_length=116 / sequence_SO=supercontig / SO=protein_coding / is_pseudo=false